MYKLYECIVLSSNILIHDITWNLHRILVKTHIFFENLPDILNDSVVFQALYLNVLFFYFLVSEYLFGTLSFVCIRIYLFPILFKCIFPSMMSLLFSFADNNNKP